MRFNSAKPIKQLTAKEREALRDALSPGTLPPIPPITTIQNQIPVEEYLMIDPEDLRDRIAQFGLQRDNSSENQGRSVEGPEIAALILTFGEDVGEFLIGRINIEFPEGLTKARVPDKVNGKRNVSEIHLPEDYNSAKLGGLGTFIHEATHIWQKNTLLHQGRADGDYEYTLDQLHSLNLNQEEHASAVQQWFIANYAYAHGLIGNSPGQARANFVWTGPLHQVLGFSHDDIRDTRDSAKIWTINVHYERLVNQIQDSTLLPPPVTKLGQNIPNPFD